ncbi:MAG: hypothetical protein GY838_11870 [bacterium]|nr:hypothetical protein [bacterium]
MIRPRVVWAVVAAVLAVLLIGPAASRAQLPHLDPLPWFAPADSTVRRALIVDLDRFDDSATDWAVNRLHLTITLPAGQAAAWFLRASYLRLDTGSGLAGERWPDALGAETAAGWPGERISNGFGPLEVGVTGPVRLPFLGDWRLAAGMGLPSGSNRLYPFSSTSLPVRFQLRHGLDLGSARLWMQGGGVAHLDATGDDLADTSFPSGYTLGTEVAWYRGRGSRSTLGYDFEDRGGRRSQLVTAALWFPWRDDTSVGLRVRRELEGDEHRPAAWYFTVSWRFEGARMEEPEAESGQ